MCSLSKSHNIRFDRRDYGTRFLFKNFKYRVLIEEMEVDCLLSHGTASFLKERTFECSDKYYVYICDICGLMATVNPEKNIYNCSVCNNTTNFSKISLPYASKLLILELYSMGLMPRFITE